MSAYPPGISAAGSRDTISVTDADTNKEKVIVISDLLNVAGVAGGTYPILTTDTWVPIPSQFRLVINGSGSLVLSYKKPGGEVIASAFSYALNNVVNRIITYIADDSVEMLAVFPASVTVKLIG